MDADRFPIDNVDRSRGEQDQRAADVGVRAFG